LFGRIRVYAVELALRGSFTPTEARAIRAALVVAERRDRPRRAFLPRNARTGST